MHQRERKDLVAETSTTQANTGYAACWGIPNRAAVGSRISGTALNTVLECERTGVRIDDQQTVAHYLHDWMQRKVAGLKPTTVASYHRYIRQDLIPALGAINWSDVYLDERVLFVRYTLSNIDNTKPVFTTPE